MTVVVAICSFLTAGVAVTLLVRLAVARRDCRAHLRPSASPDDFSQRLDHLVRASLDATMLPAASSRGLADVPLPVREPHDAYRNASELISWLAQYTAGGSYAEVCETIKGVYQLARALRAPEAEVLHCLEPLRARLLAAKVGDRSVARVEWIRPGAMLDPGTMAPLNYGARVTQPLGVLAYDSEGKVLGKAKVLCG